MTELKPVTLNCEIFWASMQEPNRMSNKYQIDLGNLSKAAADALELPFSKSSMLYSPTICAPVSGK